MPKETGPPFVEYSTSEFKFKIITQIRFFGTVEGIILRKQEIILLAWRVVRPVPFVLNTISTKLITNSQIILNQRSVCPKSTTWKITSLTDVQNSEQR